LCKRRSISEDKSYRGKEAGKVREGITGVWLGRSGRTPFFQTTSLDPRVAGKQFSGLALLCEKISVYRKKKKKKSVLGERLTLSLLVSLAHVYSVAMDF